MEKITICKALYFSPVEKNPITYEFMVDEEGKTWVKYRNPDISIHECNKYLWGCYYDAMNRGELIII